MNTAPAVEAGQRWLVLAPHPDDEVLATGGLLQVLHARGAAVRVLLLTDGENNPWPQRLLERRWRIDEAARVRWGARRRQECERSLQCLGVDPSAELEALGWADGGIDDALVGDPQSLVARISSAIGEFGATHLVLPCADDRHPDHNSAAVIADLALAQGLHEVRTFAYLVHGAPRVAPDLTLALDAEQRRVKLSALREHGTQLSLSRGRFERFVSEGEGFFGDAFANTTLRVPRVRVRERGAALEIEIEPMHPPVWRLRRPRLELVWEDRAGVLRGRLLRLGRSGHGDLWRRRGEVLTVSLDAPGGVRRLYAKIATGLHGLWIYDQAGWCRAVVSG